MDKPLHTTRLIAGQRFTAFVRPAMYRRAGWE